MSDNPEVNVSLAVFKGALAAWEENGGKSPKGFSAYFSYAGHGLTAAKMYVDTGWRTNPRGYVTFLFNSDGELVHST